MCLIFRSFYSVYFQLKKIHSVTPHMPLLKWERYFAHLNKNYKIIVIIFKNSHWIHFFNYYVDKKLLKISVLKLEPHMKYERLNMSHEVNGSPKKHLKHYLYNSNYDLHMLSRRARRLNLILTTDTQYLCAARANCSYYNFIHYLDRKFK